MRVHFPCNQLLPKSDKSVNDTNVNKENYVDDNGLKDLNREDMTAETSCTKIEKVSISQIFPCKNKYMKK